MFGVAFLLIVCILVDISKHNERETMTKNLVRNDEGQIHAKGCKHTTVDCESIVDEGYEPFAGTSLKDFAEYWTNFYNRSNPNDQTTSADWLPELKMDIKPCTGIR